MPNRLLCDYSRNNLEESRKSCSWKYFLLPPAKVYQCTRRLNNEYDSIFPISTKGVKDTNETRVNSSATVLAHMEHKYKRAVDRRKRQFKGNGPVKKDVNFSCNCKDAVAVLDIEEFKDIEVVLSVKVHVAAGRTEKQNQTAGKDKFENSTAGQGIHGTTKGRITAVNHFSTFSMTESRGVLEINHFFKMVSKNLLLKYIHKTIMRGKHDKNP